ncbi:MAG: GNAT family N-acetyltransferase [Balneolaceae bacterium]
MIDLQPFNLENIRTHYKWNNDKELNFYDSEYPHKIETFESFLSRIKSVMDSSNDQARLFEIIDLYDNKIIGVIDVYGIDHFHKRCFVSCTIGDKSYRGRGLGREALNKILYFCFEELKMKKVGATSFDFNHAWIRTLKMTGFKKEGELRKHVKKAGVFRNKLLFSILESEFIPLHNQKVKAAM